MGSPGPERPSPRGRRRCTCRSAGALLLITLLAGCSAVRGTADRGHRIVEEPGGLPSKALGMAGAMVGYGAGVPFTMLLLPTLPFSEGAPSARDGGSTAFNYPSSPQHDIPMPILFAPLEYASGIGAFIFTLPLLPFRPDLGSSESPSEWPPPRNFRTHQPSPGEAAPGVTLPPLAPPPGPEAPSLPPPLPPSATPPPPAPQGKG